MIIRNFERLTNNNKEYITYTLSGEEQVKALHGHFGVNVNLFINLKSSVEALEEKVELKKNKELRRSWMPNKLYKEAL